MAIEAAAKGDPMTINKSARTGLAVGVAGLLATGCAVVGPSAIRSGRPAYNDAIVATNSQQVLAMIVRMRYGEPSGLLAVSSVTANLHIATNVGAEFGFGQNSNYAGNLTPLTTGIAYEENPTISYTPVQGEKYLRQLLSPIPLDLTVLVLGVIGNSPPLMDLVLKGINGYANPDFQIDTATATDPRFARLVTLLAAMHQRGFLTWAQAAATPPAFVAALSGSGDSYQTMRGELYELLGFSAPPTTADHETLPVSFGLGRPSAPGIALRTRSLYELFTLAAAGMDVPDEHLQSGLAPRLPPVGSGGHAIHIRRASRCPGTALIAAKRHGEWYYIDETDAQSKLTFRLLESFMSVRMADAVGPQTAPVLTVPASR